MKLYPPHINGSIPAFYGNKLTIPFTMNKTVSKNEIGGFKLLIKTSHSNKLLATLGVYTEENKLPPWNFDFGEVYFTIPDDCNYLHIGNYYKLQLAYIDANDGTIGYYSSVSVVKYTSKPEVIVDSLEHGKVNMNENRYIGSYSQIGSDKDTTEKVYSYRFDIYDNAGNLHETSGECLHNSFEDENVFSSHDEYVLKKDLIINKNYTIQYTIKTNNGLVEKSHKYRIMQKETIDPEIRARLIATLNHNNAYVDLSLIGEKDKYGAEYSATGSYVIRRASNKDNFTEWDSILFFRLNGQAPSRWLWKDFTIEHGYTYKYAIQQFNDSGLYSNKIESNEIFVSFEDMFLWDGKRQLKIRFNPKVTSFKTNILEAKVDTIGSQYPFIFRNGNVNYKEFPISGLISYQMDEENLFIDKDKLMIENFETNLTDKNIASERIFKNEVLDWLNDGNPKLFRSPSEGNFIVRIFKSTLSPNDVVNRMLHSFSATAYEIAGFNYESLLEWGFIELIDVSNLATRWDTVPLYRLDDYGKYIGPFTREEEMLQYAPATSIRFQDCPPGTKIRISNGYEEDIITIGVTGMYKIDLDLGLKIYSVKMESSNVTEGSLVYSYQTNISNVFDTIEDVTIEDIPLRQFIGDVNVINEINDVRTTLLDFTYLHFQKRDTFILYTNSKNIGKYFWDRDCHEPILEDFSELDPSLIYKIIVMPLNNEEKEIIKYCNGNPNNLLKEYSNKFIINGSVIDLTETENYYVKNPGPIKELIVHNGLTLECGYQARVIDYSLETKNIKVRDTRNAYLNAYNEYKTLLAWETVYNKDDEKSLNYFDGDKYTTDYFTALNNAYEKLYPPQKETLYNIYLKALEEAIKKEQEESQYNGEYTD